jgi:hypothetical protein
VSQHFAGTESCLVVCGQQDELCEVSQQFADDVFCLPANFTVTIVPAATMIIIKSNLFQRLLFFLGVQHPSLQPQF